MIIDSKRNLSLRLLGRAVFFLSIKYCNIFIKYVTLQASLIIFLLYFCDFYVISIFRLQF